jgi:hypothetical protein
MKQQAAVYLKSGFLPDAIKTPEQAIVIMQKGQELQIPPMQALSHIHVIKGKPTMSAELMLAQIYRHCPGAVVNFIELTNEICVIEASRPGHKIARFSFSMEDARTAQLLGNPSWKKYPRAMLRSRCVSEMARSMFPDCIAGVSYVPEELGAVVNQDGEVIDVESEASDPQLEPANHIYRGTPEQKRDLLKLFQDYNVPEDDWKLLSVQIQDLEVCMSDVEKIVYEKYKPQEEES